MIRHKSAKPDQITLWFCHLDEPVSPTKLKIFHNWLSDAEKQKVARFRLSEARDKGLLVRAALRHVLTQYASISTKGWQFEYGEKGKPRLCDQQREETGLEFNLSHSGDWLVIAVCQAVEMPLQLGVDIERFREKTDIYPILKHYFSQYEIDDLLGLEENKRRDRFFDLWALKESYIKAKGLGLALNLKSFEFDFSLQQVSSINLDGSNSQTTLPLFKKIKIKLLPRSNDAVIGAAEKENWQVVMGRLDDTYRFALCVDREAAMADIQATHFSLNDTNVENELAEEET